MEGGLHLEEGVESGLAAFAYGGGGLPEEAEAQVVEASRSKASRLA